MFFLRKKSKSVLFFLVCSNFSLAVPEFQSSPTSELSERRIRFDKLEQRAVRLSQQIGKLSATDPIILIDRNASLEQVNIESDAQTNFDALPGPFVEPLTLVPPKEEASSSVIFNSKVKNVVPTTQQRKGDYYFLPKVGISISSNLDIRYNAYGSSEVNDELNGEWGNSVTLATGKRWDNWFADLSFSYHYHTYSNTNLFDDIQFTLMPATSKQEAFLLGLTGGYSVPISTKLSHTGGIGFGLGWRRDSMDVDFYDGWDWYTLPPQNSTSFIFSYNFSLGLEYLFVNNFSGFLGYKFLGMSQNNNFGSSMQHQIDLGVGVNF